MSENLSLLRRAISPPQPSDATVADFEKEVRHAVQNPALVAGFGGPKERTPIEVALALLETKGELSSKKRDEMLAHIRAVEEMRTARRRLLVQIVVTGTILIGCVIILIAELQREDVRKEWLTLASGFVGTVVGYWLR